MTTTNAEAKSTERSYVSRQAVFLVAMTTNTSGEIKRKETLVTDENTNDDNEDDDENSDGKVSITAPFHPIIDTASTATITATDNNDNDNGNGNGNDPRVHHPPITTILPELSLQIFAFLTIPDLGNIQAACQYWNTVINRDRADGGRTMTSGGAASWFWKRVYELHFRCRVSTHTPDWKSNCRHRLVEAAGRCSSPQDFSTGCVGATFDADDDDTAGFEFRNERRISLYHGYSNSIRSRQQLFDLHASTTGTADGNGNGWSYFEATVWGEGSVGIVSIETEEDRRIYGDGSQLHIGWYGHSYGYHNDDGLVYIADKSKRVRRGRFRYQKLPYGPPWGTEMPETPSVVGCGYNRVTNALFFTLDGSFLGLVSSKTYPGLRYAAAVTLHNLNDRVRLNLGQFPFVFDADHFCFES